MTIRETILANVEKRGIEKGRKQVEEKLERERKQAKEKLERERRIVILDLQQEGFSNERIAKMYNITVEEILRLTKNTK